MDLKSNNTFAILREEEKKEISLEIEFKRDTSATYLCRNYIYGNMKYSECRISHQFLNAVRYKIYNWDDIYPESIVNSLFITWKYKIQRLIYSKIVRLNETPF